MTNSTAEDFAPPDPEGQLLGEELLSLSAAARILPRRRGGKKVHTATLYRWTTTGLKGVVLESLQVGGTRCTSRQSLQRFFEQLSPLRTTHHSSDCRSQKSKQAMLVEKQLDDLGV